MHVRDRQAALEGARQGDTQALGNLLESFRPYLRAIVHARRNGQLPAQFDDSDLIQDALLEAQRGFVGFRGTTVAELAVWLRQIAVRVSGQALRGYLATEKRDVSREAPGDELGELLVAPGSSPSEQAIREEEAARLTAAMSRLPADMQQVLLDRHLDVLPYAVIAERLGRSEAAVRVLYVRALDRLRSLCTGE